MSERRDSLDVWIVDSNTVYREVPYTVVADWLQEGRLLENDKVRSSGSDAWQLIADTSNLAAFLPKVEPFRANDQAEALEPVEFDFAWKKPDSGEDDDPDMIPLIDISLVLLIFFMMTSTVVVASSRINVPDVNYGATLAGSGMIWIGIDKKPDGGAVYAIGEGDKAAARDDQELTEAQLLQKVAARMKGLQEPVEVRITADRSLPYEVVKKMTVALEPYRQGRRIKAIRAEVSEAKP
jgi:biopolymer transport protein ExbD